MSDFKFYLNFNPKNSKNRLSLLPTQGLKALFDLTQPKEAPDGSEITPNLYFAGTKAQKPRKHFDLFNSYFSKSKNSDDYQPINNQQLLERFTIGFDSDESNDKIWKWDDWKESNPRYDPKKFILGDTGDKDIDEKLFDDLPKFDGIDCENHSLNVKESLINLTQSLEVVSQDKDDTSSKQEEEKDNKSDNQDSDSEKCLEFSDSSSESTNESQSEEPITMVQRNILKAVQIELEQNVDKFLNYQKNHNVSHTWLQVATQNISMHYLSLLAYHE